MEDNAPALEPTTLVNHEKGIVSASIFVEHDIYKREIEQIFARSWLYLCHESQVSQPGDFTAARMGEDGLLVCRGPQWPPQRLPQYVPHLQQPALAR